MERRYLLMWLSPLLVATTLTFPVSAQRLLDIPSPEDFFGFPMGADRQLAHWDDMVDYFNLIDDLSDRIKVKELGKTTLGEPYLLVVASTPETIRDLSNYQDMQHELADPRNTTLERAEEISQTGKAVVLIGANVHATEIGTSQVMNDLIYEFATGQSKWTRNILENAVLLLIPSQNPDGQKMVVDWYRKNLGTAYEGSRLPELYHYYAGHDNNRDSYMLTQIETQHLNQVLYKDWLPEVYLDVHQMGNRNARIFVPPFKNPVNPNVDPLIWSQVNQLGQAMASRLHAADKTGVIWGELYSGFWQGANNTNPWWHNMVGLLTETASANLGTPVLQQRASPFKRQNRVSRNSFTRRRGLNLPLPPPLDTQSRMNYPRPWLGGLWTLGDTVDYSRLAIEGLLENVANNRALLKKNFYLMNQRTIEKFSNGAPFAFVIPAKQHDPIAVAKLIELLQSEAAEIEIANHSFRADGVTYPAGTYVAKLAQPFGRWIKDILEPQTYPDIRWPHSNSPIDKPYDVTAWSLGMLMGVETIRIDRPFKADLRFIGKNQLVATGNLTGNGATFVIPHTTNNSFSAINRLLRAGATVRRTLESTVLEQDISYGPGLILVNDVDDATVQEIAGDLHLQIRSTDVPNEIPTYEIQKTRVAVYEPWGGNMDAGWTRWVLDQHDFEHDQIRSADLIDENIKNKFDVIILPEMSSVTLIQGLQGPNIRPEYRGGIGAQGKQNLLNFVTDGGILITLGNTAKFAIDHLNVPVTNVVGGQSEESFYCPGSILRVAVDTSHPIGFGLPDNVNAMFVGNGGYLAKRTPGGENVKTIATYPNSKLLQSGWLTGGEQLRRTAASMEYPLGDGRIILHTFRVQHRGQTWGTFKLLFNSIFYGSVADSTPSNNVSDKSD